MIPSSNYFRPVTEGFPGAQRIGFEWFAFIDADSLSRALEDGCFETANESPIDSLAESGSDLVEELEASVQKLKEELKEERT